VIRAHILNRITCLWHWEWLSTAAWSAMAHVPAGVGVLVCVATGWFAWDRLPLQPVDQAPAPAVYLPGTDVRPVTQVPEPWPIAVLAVGLIWLVRERTRRAAA
jgi:hypothetical protein